MHKALRAVACEGDLQSQHYVTILHGALPRAHEYRAQDTKPQLNNGEAIDNGVSAVLRDGVGRILRGGAIFDRDGSRLLPPLTGSRGRKQL